MRIFFLSIAILLVASQTFSQETADPLPRSPELELMLESANDDEADQSATYDELEFYRQHPININTASFDEMAKIPFLPATSVVRILLLRDSLTILSAANLRSVPELDERTFALVSQFITFKREEASENSFLTGFPKILFRSREASDIQERKSFRDGDYLGTRLRQYHRLEIIQSQVSGGILYDQDTGERINDGFVSGYVGTGNVGIIKRFVVGNFTLNSGQGLTLSRFRSSSKGGNAISQIKASGKTIVPHLSSDEFHYFQGAAATVDLFPAALTIFYSRKTLAATVDTANTVTSFYTSGLFRSQTELKRKDAVNETVIGGIADIHIGRTHRVGVTAFQTEYDKEVAIRSVYNLGGRSVAALGMNADFVFDSFNLLGELAGNSWNTKSGVAGLIYRISKRLSVATHVRSYSQSYSNPFAYGFGERNGIVNNERGRYLGFEFRPMSAIKISSYYDEFVLPSSNFFTSTGNEYVIRYEQTITKSLNSYLQFKSKSKTQKDVLLDTQERDITQTRIQQTLRASFSFAVSKSIELSQRVEFTSVNYSVTQKREQGMLMFTELNLSFPSSRFFGTARMIFFDTQSYDSRLYEYEADVRGGYSIPPLYGQGIRWYVVAGYKIFSQMELSFKYSETIKSGAATIGSGDSEIIGPLDNKVTFQVDVVL